MATFAVMSGNIVSTIIVADDKEATEAALGCILIEYTPENPAGIGWNYDESTGRFIAPEVVDPIVSANDKLLAAGLSQEEINALMQEMATTNGIIIQED
jgi:hypothetical protein